MGSREGFASQIHLFLISTATTLVQEHHLEPDDFHGLKLSQDPTLNSPIHPTTAGREVSQIQISYSHYYTLPRSLRWLPMDLRAKPKPAIRPSVHTICPLCRGLYPPQAAPASCPPAPSQVHPGMPAGFLPTSERPPHLKEASSLISILSTLIIPFTSPCQSCHCVFAPSPGWLSSQRCQLQEVRMVILAGKQ